MVHFCQYRLLQGDYITTGGLNELLCVIDLLVLSCLFKQREVTKEEIMEKMQRFERKLVNQEDPDDMRARQESVKESVNNEPQDKAFSERRESILDKKEIKEYLERSNSRSSKQE